MHRWTPERTAPGTACTRAAARTPRTARSPTAARRMPRPSGTAEPHPAPQRPRGGGREGRQRRQDGGPVARPASAERGSGGPGPARAVRALRGNLPADPAGAPPPDDRRPHREQQDAEHRHAGAVAERDADAVERDREDDDGHEVEDGDEREQDEPRRESRQLQQHDAVEDRHPRLPALLPRLAEHGRQRERDPDVQAGGQQQGEQHPEEHAGDVGGGGSGGSHGIGRAGSARRLPLSAVRVRAPGSDAGNRSNDLNDTVASSPRHTPRSRRRPRRSASTASQ